MWFLILRIEFYNTRMIGGFTMKHKLKDPGSAITLDRNDPCRDRFHSIDHQEFFKR